MKQISRLIIAITCVLFIGTTSQAQIGGGDMIISVDAGYSIQVGVIKAVFNNRTLKDSAGNQLSSSVKSSPAVVIGLDYGLASAFSVGGIVSTQIINGTVGHAFVDDDKNYLEEDVDFKIRRSNVSVTPRFHFAPTDQLDLYAGARIGITFWSTKIDARDTRFDDLDRFAKLATPSFGITTGARLFFTEKLAVHGEFNIGAPNILGLGLSYKM